MTKIREHLIASLEEDAIVHWISCVQGKLPIRQWQNTGADKIVLLHGGSGSWLHWVKNIRALQKHFDVYAIDLPGLGDAAMCDIDSDATSAAAQTAQAVESLFDGPFHIVAFSWGCTVTALIMARLEGRLKSVMLTARCCWRSATWTAVETVSKANCADEPGRSPGGSS